MFRTSFPQTDKRLISRWESHVTRAISHYRHGNDAAFTWASIIVWSAVRFSPLNQLFGWIKRSSELYFWYFSLVLLPRPSLNEQNASSTITVSISQQQQWHHGPFSPGSPDRRESWKLLPVAWDFPHWQTCTTRRQKLSPTKHAPKKKWAAKLVTAVRTLAVSTTLVDSCFRPNSGILIPLLGLIILGLFMDFG